MARSEIDEQVHINIHREADELGKFAALLRFQSGRTIPHQEAAALLDELLVRTSQSSLDNGADLIGHAKAFLRTEKGAISASLIDVTKRSTITYDFVEEADFRNAELTLHIIVHGIWDPEVRVATLDALRKLLNERDIDYELVADHFDTEKGIDHHIKK